MKKSKFDLVHATESQIREVKSEITALEKLLHENDDPNNHVRIQDPAEVQKEILNKKKFVNDFAPKKLTGQRSNRAYREAKKLKEVIVAAMPSQNQYFQRQTTDKDRHSRHTDFEKTVQQQIKFQTDPGILKAVNRYKHLMRRIDPADPTISNIELLRP